MKILYGVTGEGMGHATRSQVILSHLQKNHEILIVASNKAYTFLKDSFPQNIIEIEGLILEYENHTLKIPKTIKSNLKSLTKKARTNYRKFKETLRTYTPDIIISDFDSFAYIFGKISNTPIISIDNMQILNRCKLEVPKKFRKDYLLAKTVVKSKLPACAHYLISTFFNVPIKKRKTTLIPPILRNEILSVPPVKGEPILVYLTLTSSPNLLKTLKQINEKFIIYGFNKTEKDKNLTFKEFSKHGFIEDLANSKAVISSSGFSLMTEALYLKKPFFAIPIKGQFEQALNGIYLQKLGFGEYHMGITKEKIENFLNKLDFYEENLKKYKQDGNKKTLKQLDFLLKKIQKQQ